jgi:hypothetical protein
VAAITVAWFSQNETQATSIPNSNHVNQLVAYTAPGATEPIIRFNPAGKQAPGPKVQNPMPSPKGDVIKPKIDPIVLPKGDVIRPKVDPIVLPKGDVIKPKIDPIVLPKGDIVNPKVDPIIRPKIDLGAADKRIINRPIDAQIIQPKMGEKLDLSKQVVPGLKLGNAKIDPAELNKLKAPIDLNKVKPEVVLNAKPPVDFKPQKMDLNKIHIPNNAAQVNSLTHLSLKPGQQFVINKAACLTGNYHLKCGTVFGGGYCFVGAHHCHWHHSIWDPCFGCHYYYCPCTCGYFYWCASAATYYPCHWFVSYCDCYYPWWLCGGFSGCGYVAPPCYSIYVGF